MLKDLELLVGQLHSFGLKTRAHDIDLIIRSIAGDKSVDKDIENTIINLIKTSNNKRVKKEVTELLMLHGDYTGFLKNCSIESVGSSFYIKHSNGLRITELTKTPEEAVALFLIKNIKP